MSDEIADSSAIERRAVLRNLAVGAVGLTGLVGTSAAEALDDGTDGGGPGPNKKACYWEHKCEEGNHYVRECCPYVLYPDGAECGAWEDTGDQLCL